MSNLPAQKQELVRYFTEGCKPQGKLTLGVEVEHFVTHTDGSPVTFEEVQRVMQEMQGTHDTPVYIDGLYMGYHNPLYSVSLEPACQLEISIVPETEVDDILTAIRPLIRRWRSFWPGTACRPMRWATIPPAGRSSCR